jgi:hypothetical protein
MRTDASPLARPGASGYVDPVAEQPPTARDAVAPDIEPVYRLAAVGREAAEEERLNLLEQLYDPVSRRRRAPVQRGWKCLEVAARRGSTSPIDARSR